MVIAAVLIIVTSESAFAVVVVAIRFMLFVIVRFKVFVGMVTTSRT